MKTNRYFRNLITLAAVCGLILSTQSFAAQASSGGQSSAPSATFVVNSTADTTDANQGDHICADATGHCTLRAAIMQANFFNDADTITIPAGTYTLTAQGNNEDTAVTGDLDILNDVTIQGAGSGNTIIDGNGSVLNDRVFQIFPGAKNTSISGLTIRNGALTGVFDAGAGLSWAGGGSSTLTLSDVVFENNSARYGGGLSLDYGTGGTVTMDHIVVRSNLGLIAGQLSGGAGAGMSVIFSKTLSAFTLKNSQIYNNTGANQGGGIELEGTQDGTSPETIQNVEIYGNKAGFGAGIDNYGGTSPYKIDLSDSNIHDNQALAQGGGINNFKLINITRTTLSANQGGLYGGGLFNQNSNSINQVQAIIDQSTFSYNMAQTGGGIYNDTQQTGGAQVTLTNSTVTLNTASHDGGGIYANKGEVSIFSSTITNNQVVVPQGDSHTGFGGGIYATSALFIPMGDSVIAGNSHVYGFGLRIPDDCLGPITSYDYNLVQTTTNCLITNLVTHNIYAKDPLLGGLASNGGPTHTQSPKELSPLVDAGVSASCPGAGGNPLTIDQRGFPRVVGSRCDIGAVERGPFSGPTGYDLFVYIPIINH